MHSTGDMNHGLASVVKAMLWSKMAVPPLPPLPTLPHDLSDDNDSPPAFATRKH